MSDPLTVLRHSTLLDGVDDSLCQHLVDKARKRSISKRDTRIDSDELSYRLFMVLSGNVRVLRLAADGQECLMQRVAPGDFFCLASLCSGRHCGSQLVCDSGAELLFWDHDSYRQLLNRNPELNRNLMRHIACQVEEERDMRALSHCCKADTRVAAFLLHKLKGHCHCRCNRHAVDLKPVSLAAREIGLARETFSRSLQKLAKRQVIQYERGTVRVANLDVLESVLEESDCDCQRG